MRKTLLFLIPIALLIGCKSDKKDPVKTEESIEIHSIVKVLKPSEFKDGIMNEDVQLVDVRTPSEYDEGHIEDATLIDYQSEDFKDRIQQLDKSKPVYIYCRSGGRSGMASEIMSELGFIEVYDLEGGILAWE